MRELPTFTGDDLAEGFPGVVFAPADLVKLFFPHPGTGDLVFPTITEKGWTFPEDSGDPLYRDYTVRAYDADAHELTIDFVVHDHGVAGSGPATLSPVPNWACSAPALKPIRRYLCREIGLPKYQVDVDGYWKKGTANLDHHSNEPA